MLHPIEKRCGYRHDCSNGRDVADAAPHGVMTCFADVTM